MEKQEKNQLKDLLKKYIDSTPMDSNQLMSASEVINMLDDSSANGGPTKDDKNSSKKSAKELNKDLEEANEFLKYVTNMYAKAFGIDESELEDSDNEDSDNEDSSEDSVSLFDLDIKEADDISDNLYDWGLEDAKVDIDKDGNVLVYGLLPGDALQFTEAFNDAFSKDMSKQDITDYLKDAYNRYNSNKPLKDSYDEGCPIEDDPQNGRVFLKEMVVKIPPMGSEEEKEYELFEDGDNFYFYFDGVKYILNKTPEASYFSLIDKVYPLYDNDSSKVGYHAHTPFEINKETPFRVSLDNMRVTSEDGEYTLVKLTEYNQELPHFSFVADNTLFLIYFDSGSNAFYVSSKNQI